MPEINLQILFDSALLVAIVGGLLRMENRMTTVETLVRLLVKRTGLGATATADEGAGDGS